jgi:hydrogenase expression/formation protein HypE
VKAFEGPRRPRKPVIRESHITLAHGSGGRAMHDLIEGLFLEYFRNPLLEKLEDQAVITLDADARRLAFTTDTYVVTPLFFPGGDIGRLAVYGTVNDLAMSGARPLCLSAGFVLEEGFPIDDLRRITASMSAAAAECGIPIATGDTKVVEKGSADGVFINTSGIGVVHADAQISVSGARPGDCILLNGPIGEHGIAVLTARGDLELETDIHSDSAPLHGLVAEMLDAAGDLDAVDQIHCLRDPTRGGLGTSLNEIAASSNVAIEIDENRIPVRQEVRGACEILGLDPLYVANEGRFVAVVSEAIAEVVLERLRRHPLGRNAGLIGRVTAEPPGIVTMTTTFGGKRLIDMLVGEQLPRIC